MVEKNIRLKTHLGNGVYDTLHPETNSEIVRVGSKNLDETLGEVTAQLAQTNQKKADVTYVDQSVSRISGGAIKGTYTTLSALEQAYPDGSVGPFQIEEDGERYVWDVNKNQWVSIGPYDPANIAPNSVGYEEIALEPKEDLLLPMENEVVNGDLSSGITNWIITNADVTNYDSELVFTATTTSGNVRNSITSESNHIYYAFIQIQATSKTVGLDYHGYKTSYHSGSGSFEFLSLVYEESTSGTRRVGPRDYRTSGWDEVRAKYLGVIDLTATFGYEKEPTIEQMDKMLNRFDKKWFAGIANAWNARNITPLILENLGQIQHPIPKKEGYFIASINNASLSEGAIGQNSFYSMTYLFSVSGLGTTFKTNYLGGSANSISLAKCDKYGKFIRSVAIGDVGKEIKYTLTEPEEYFIMSASQTFADKFEITVDSRASVRVIPDGYLSDLKHQIDNVNAENKLYGKEIVGIGDSYLKGHTLDENLTWFAKLADKYNMTSHNYGINGNAITVETASGLPMNVRYADMVNSADYIIVQAGKNDYNQNVPIDDFKAGVDVLLDGLINKYTGKKLGFITPWNIGNATNGIGLKLYDYVDAIKERCAAKSIPCFDASADSGVFMFNSKFISAYSLDTGNSHLNEAGMEYFLPKPEHFIQSL